MLQKLRTPTQVRIKGLPAGFEIGAIVRPETGDVLSFDQLLADLETARIVYVGETHTNETHHYVQLKILKALFERWGDTSVGMEMFEASYQDVLDQWSRDLLDEASLLEGVDWENTWTFDFSLYRPILDFIRMESLTVVGLNVPGAIVDKVAREGLDSLSEEERGRIAREIDTSHERHRAYVKEVFERHESDDLKEFNFFYEAQCVWDDSMAQTIAEALNNNRVVVLAGNGHIAYKFGIPDRAYGRTRASFRTVMPVAVGTEVESDVADYIWVTHRQMPRPRRPVVGIRLEAMDNGKGVLIKGVIEKSPAALAGIKAQDILLAVDGRPITSLMDVHKAMAGAKRAPTHVFRIERQGETLELTIRLKKRTQHD
ncbi:MAG: ChaN family lipoprotein [Desulfobacterales bacterium]|nr:ChaN family lipoprotein [Desulfobacterales bacterium]